AGRAPLLLAGHLVERHQRAALDAGVDDQQALVEHRRGARAPARGARADADVPELLAGQVEAEHPRPAEEEVQPFAAAGRRARGIAVSAVVARRVLRLGQLGLHLLGPARLARLAVQAEHVPDEVLLVAGLGLALRVAAVAGEEDGVADRDRAGGAQ